MTSKPPISQLLTQAIQQLAKQNTLKLKKGARVAQLQVEDENSQTSVSYPLLGDRCLIGRSSKNDIVIGNSIVSQVHCSIHKDSQDSPHFWLRDEQSTNGTYKGQKRLKNPIRLQHGDLITLGSPEVTGGVNLVYHNPAPLWMQLVRCSLYGFTGVFGLIAAWVLWEWSKVPVFPLPSGLSGPVVVYAGDGRTPLNSLEKRPHVEIDRLSEFSPYLPKAAIASEDSRFYWHLGVDPIGITRAILVNAKDSQIRQGASTLTQQLARSLFPQVGRENTAGRKIREILVALKLETFYSKDEILKTYLNRVYLGNGHHGFEDAAQFYFEKSARDLNISEAATLVAILPAPNSYNPVINPDTALSLRNRVINRMLQQGMISAQEAMTARRSRIEVSPQAQEALSNTLAPYFYAHVFQELQDLLGNELAKEGNFIVETALDLNLQAKAEKALKNKVQTDGSHLGYSQGALVTLNTKTGEVLALVGGVDYQKSQFNRATQAKRQPGSTFKLFAYTTALENGIPPYKVYSCEGLRWQGQSYRPCERSGGEINMIQAFALSENAVALRVAQEVGLSNTVEVAQRLGIESSLKAVPGLILGQSEVSVLEITGAYGAIANQGQWNRPHTIRRILDGSDCKDHNNISTCREIYSFGGDRHNHHQAISQNTAQMMMNLLQAVINEGTGRGAYLGLGEGGKTGTTNRNVDLWFIGMIPQNNLVTGIWLGNDDNTPTQGSSGQAAALWKDYMATLFNP